MDIRRSFQTFLVVLFVVLTIEGKKHNTLEAREEKIRTVRDVEVEIEYEPVGCFRDQNSKNQPRLLDKLVKNFRKKGNLPDGKNIWDFWEDMSEVIQLCAESAFKDGYTAVFGIQYFGECWSGKNAALNYDKYGKSGNCINGVGKASTNYIYRIKAHPLPVKSSPACNVEGQTYDEGDSMEVYNGDHKNGQCDQCTCANGKIDDCHFLFDCVMNDSSCNGYVKTSAQCCPKCQKDVPSNAPVCKVDDQTYKQGDSLELLRDFHGKQLGECHQCTCMAGKLEKCHRIYYCEKNKAGCNSHIKIPGQCCPACARVVPKPSPPYCKVGARHYKDGESMEVFYMSADKKTAACDQCSCQGGKVDGCHHLFYCEMDNPECVRYEHRVDQCCPTCVLANPKPPALSCKINGRLFHDGESAEVLQQSVDKSSIICQQCKCDAGRHKCHKIFDCDIQELGCEKSVKITGQCCPVCACYNNGEQLSPGDQWQRVSGEDCVTCTCQQGGIAHCTRKPGSCQSE